MILALIFAFVSGAEKLSANSFHYPLMDEHVSERWNIFFCISVCKYIPGKKTSPLLCFFLIWRYWQGFEVFRAQINTLLEHNNTAAKANCWRVLVQKKNPSEILHCVFTVRKINRKGKDEHDERGEHGAAQHLLSVKTRADVAVA